MGRSEDKAAKLQKMQAQTLEAGAVAKLQIYQSLLYRVKNGESLKPSEIRLIREIERDLERGAVDDSSKIYGFAAAAEYCGLSKRTISYHLNRGNFRQGQDGSFDKAELDKWLASKGRKRKAAAGEVDQVQGEKDKADLRYRIARAMREELLVDQIRGNYLPKADVYGEWAARVLEIKAGLLNWKDRLVPLLVGKSAEGMREILDAEVWLLLDQYARFGRYSPEITQEGGGNESV